MGAFSAYFIIIISWKHLIGKKTVARKTKMHDRAIDLHQKLVIKICESWAKILHEPDFWFLQWILLKNKCDIYDFFFNWS